MKIGLNDVMDRILKAFYYLNILLGTSDTNQATCRNLYQTDS